jgi:hypothetical protein
MALWVGRSHAAGDLGMEESRKGGYGMRASPTVGVTRLMTGLNAAEPLDSLGWHSTQVSIPPVWACSRWYLPAHAENTKGILSRT